ncbi:O-antigen ligase family protein [Chitinophaga sp. sic0106]|uniref:O-antigen ligase family protein n=1 Tax=Chitinophaga sp. sic0106 TaxID=2854785 RepID=UPI001C47A563|nr:O-antigen ligase family protein [Chitinophaga sp. sic0106]MBV7532006.1 hypothetical protein [Chitinophaga sp. sic0106]
MLEPIKAYRSDLLLFSLMAIAVPAVPYLTAGNYRTGVLILVAIFGIALATTCLNNAKLGFYITLTTVITIRFFERIYQQEAPVGVVLDLMIFSSALGTMLKKSRTTEGAINYFREPIFLMLFLQFSYYMLESLNPMAPNKTTLGIFFRISLRYLFIAILTTIALRSKKDIYFFFKFWIGLSTISAFYGCYQEWFGLPSWEMALIMTTPEKLLTTMIGGHLRVNGTMTDPAVYGLMMAITSILLIILLTASNSWINLQRKGLIVLSLILHLLALGYSGTRTGYVMIPAGLLLFLLVTIHKRNTILAAMFLIFAGGGILFGPFYGNATINRVRTAFIGTEDASLNVREINRHSVQPFIHSHPFGGGLFTIGGEGRAYNPGHPLAGFPPDSNLVRVVLECGWVMLLFLLFMYYLQLRFCLQNYFRFTDEKDKLLAIATASMVFAFIISMYAQESGGLMEMAVFMNTLAGVIVRSRYL